MEIQTNENGAVCWINGPFASRRLEQMRIGIHFESGIVQPLSGREPPPYVKLAVGQSQSWIWSGYKITVERVSGASPSGKVIALDKFQKARER
jgi:hypothetical protein